MWRVYQTNWPKKYPALLLSLVTLGLLVTLPVSAQQPFDLTVSPHFFDLAVKPGGSLKDTIRLHNNGSAPLTLTIEIKKLHTQGDQGEVIPADIPSTDEFINWIRLPNATLTVPPGEWVEVPFEITASPQAAFGYYYAFVMSQRSPESTNTTAKLTGGVAIPILLKIERPDAVASAQLIQFKSRNFINEYLPIDFQIQIKNTGTVHIKPRGNIFIHSSKSKDAALLEVNPELGSILPNSLRVFESAWDDGFMVQEPVVVDKQVSLDSNGQPRTKLMLHWDKLPKLRFGRYTAQLVMVYDDGQRDVPLEGETTFWVVPYRVIGAAIVGLLTLVLAIRLLLKRYIRRQVRRYRRQ